MVSKGESLIKGRNLRFDRQLEQVNFLDRRVYKRDENIYYPSVTTILEFLPKNKFFEQWLKDVGHNADIIVRKAGFEGTQVHNAVEALLKGEELEWMDSSGNARYDAHVWAMILRFKEFWNRFQPKLVATEQFVYSDKYKYAGTLDLLVEMKDQLWLLDVKTSNDLYRAYDLQISAYAKAVEEVTEQKVDRTGILWLKSSKRKEGEWQGKGWELKIVDDIEKNFDLFLTVYKLFSLENPTVEPIYKQYPIKVKL